MDVYRSMTKKEGFKMSCGNACTWFCCPHDSSPMEDPAVIATTSKIDAIKTMVTSLDQSVNNLAENVRFLYDQDEEVSPDQEVIQDDTEPHPSTSTEQVVLRKSIKRRPTVGFRSQIEGEY